MLLLGAGLGTGLGNHGDLEEFLSIGTRRKLCNGADAGDLGGAIPYFAALRQEFDRPMELTVSGVLRTL